MAITIDDIFYKDKKVGIILLNQKEKLSTI